MKRYSITIFSVIILFALVLGACSSSTPQAPAAEEVIETEIRNYYDAFTIVLELR